MIETISVVRKNNLQNVAGSRKINIPTSTAPTAPMPVHTQYAVPSEMVSVAFASKTALRTYSIPKAVIQLHQSLEAPFALPKQYVKPTSHRPATIRIIQFIAYCPFLQIIKVIVTIYIK